MDTKSRQIILRVTLRFQSNERFVASVVVVVGIITDAQAKPDRHQVEQRRRRLRLLPHKQ